MSMDSRFFIVMWKIQFNVGDNHRVWRFVFWWRKCNFQGNLSSSQLHLLLCIYLQRRFLYIPFFYLSLWTIWGLCFMFLPTPSTALHTCKVDLYTYWLHSYLDYSSFFVLCASFSRWGNEGVKYWKKTNPILEKGTKVRVKLIKEPPIYLLTTKIGPERPTGYGLLIHS